MKLNKATLKNFRGARGDSPLTINFDSGCSVLIYGDNGTGKSSFTDAFEWLITDKVKHLAGNEVGNNGGLKNTFSSEDAESYVEVEFNNQSKLKKELIQKSDKFRSKFSDSEADKKLTESLRLEHLFIRNGDLIEFIIRTGGERLADISNIIGFQDLKNTKETLKKAVNNLGRTIRDKNYEALISSNKNKILEKLKATVNSEKQLYNSIASELKKLKIKKDVKDEATLKKALKVLKAGVNEEEIRRRNRINSCESSLEDGLLKIKASLTRVLSFVTELKKLRSDKEKLEKISVVKLLQEGAIVIESGANDECPLCERSIDRESLIILIKERLETLHDLQMQLDGLGEEKRALQNTFVEIERVLDGSLDLLEKLKLEGMALEKFKTDYAYLAEMKDQLGLEILDINDEKLSLDNSKFKNIEKTLQELKNLTSSGGGEKIEARVELYSAITASCDAFNEIKKLQQEKMAIGSQKDTMEAILSLFNQVRKNEMNAFLNDISQDVNEYYLYMNHAEKVDEIKLTPNIDSEEDLVGISIELKFHGLPVSAPKKFLSESYINCLGLCIFLASVKLFNKTAKFFVLDDVISSFDKPHRIRFGQLLEEKFSDYQILVLTHEQEWFEYMRSAVKGKNWKTIRTQWNVEEGTYLALPPAEIKEAIEDMLDKKQETGLGNLIRRYAEKCLKELCYNLQVQVDFHYNDTNENRMLGVLLTSVMSRLKKKSSSLKDKFSSSKLASFTFITNKSSHDSNISENLNDLKVAYENISEFYNLFYCDICSRLVNYQYVNITKKTISCKCEKKELEWK